MAEPAREATERPNSSSVDSRYLTKSDEVARAIKVFRDQRLPLNLRFHESNQAFTAKVLDVHGNDLLLEDVQPREGLKVLRQRKPFSFAGRADGIYIYSQENQVHKTASERSLPFFHVRLPTCLLYQQRRRAARFRLPLRVATNGASITLFRGEPIVGHIIDISAGGVRAEFQGPISPMVDTDEEVPTIAITIPNLLELHSKGIIRHFNHSEEKQRLTCGVELTEMHVTDRRRLEQFIQSIAKISPPA